MSDVLTVLTQVGVLVFVVAGMAAMGLSLTLGAIVGPLRNARLVVGVNVANFVVVPAVAVGASRLIPMDDASAAAVVLVGCCAGAPFLPTLAGLAKSDAATAVGVMVLLMVLTVVVAPLLVPLVLNGATVAAGDIASSLVLYMLVPLALGLVVRARYPGVAGHLSEAFRRASSSGLVIGIVSGLLVTWSEVLGSIGTWIFVGTAIVLVAGYAAGVVAGLFAGATTDRSLLGLATAQRNISAALVIAAPLGTNTVVRTLVAALVIPIVLIVFAGEMGRRSSRTAPSTPAN